MVLDAGSGLGCEGGGGGLFGLLGGGEEGFSQGELGVEERALFGLVLG